MAANTPLLIVFTRNPVPGKSKTRLIPALGADGAAALQREMTIHTVAIARRACAANGWSMEMHYSGGTAADFHSWLGADLAYRPQTGGDLGRRMREAFEEAFARGFDAVAIIGADCPDLGGETLARAFDSLARHDLVLGPARDGGYYLIGLRAPRPELFVGVPWSSDSTLRETLRIATEIGATHDLLEPLSDVDVPEDLAVWERARGEGGKG